MTGPGRRRLRVYLSHSPEARANYYGDEALAELREATAIPFGGYANAGRVDDVRGWEPDPSLTGHGYAASVAPWLALGASIVGGCCGSHAGHTAAVRALLNARGGAA